MKGVFSQVSQDVLRRLDKAFVAFFRRRKEGLKKPGYPRVKVNTNPSPIHRQDSSLKAQS